MYQHLCVADHCGIRDQHTEQCPGQGCRGCLPRQAADGLRLCDVDTRRIAEDARTAAVLYEDLTLTIIRAQKASQGIGAGRSHSGAPVPDDDVVEARDAIRATLVSLCRTILEERGIGRPADDVPAMAAYIERHHVWLAAHPAANEHAKDLRDIAGDGRNWRLAYPCGNDRLYIGDCPLIVADLDGSNPDPCGTRLYGYGDQPLIQCTGCGAEETIEWWQRQIVGDATKLVDAYAGAADLAMRWSRPVDPGLIRKWASLDKPRVERLPPGFIGPPRCIRVERKGRDAKQRTLYDLDQLRRYAESLWAAALRPTPARPAELVLSASA